MGVWSFIFLTYQLIGQISIMMLMIIGTCKENMQGGSRMWSHPGIPCQLAPVCYYLWLLGDFGDMKHLERFMVFGNVQ